MALSIGSRLEIHGNKIPMLGLGTWQLHNVENAVSAALAAGYRHIDTAAIYGNEREVGNAIRKSGLPREDIFVTTKLWNDDHDDVGKALDSSLRELGLDYVDLYLIHWPVPQRLASWKALQRLVAKGKCRSVGVSNFTITHLQQLSTVPAVNQVEFSPFLYQKELLDYCKSKKIVLEAYSPLSRSRKLGDPTLKEIATAYGKSPAQVMLRWALQHGIVAIPKSSHEDRIRENADVFDFSLSKGDMERLDALNENFRTCWDPNGMN